MSAELLWSQLETAISSEQSREVKKLIEQLDDEAMIGEEYPEEYFSLILRILSNDKAQKSDHIHNILLYLDTDSERLSKEKLKKLAEKIESNIEKYQDDMFAQTAVDFIARNYSGDKILKLFKSFYLKDIPNKNSLLKMGISIAISNRLLDENKGFKFLEEIGFEKVT